LRGEPRETLTLEETPQKLLLLQVDRRLRDLVKSGNGLCVRLITALFKDELRKLCSDIHVRLFKSAAAQRASPARARRTNIGLAGGQAREIFIRTVAYKSLIIRE